MKVLVCGSRHATREVWKRVVSRELYELNCHDYVLIITGGAKGIDSIADEIALIYRFEVKIIEANWQEDGPMAGPIRNAKMIAENPDLVLAFTDSLGKSRGTKDTVEQAREKGIKVVVVNRDGLKFNYGEP